MGTERREITIGAFISRHNSPQDESDDQDWEQLVSEIKSLVSLYPQIRADIF